LISGVRSGSIAVLACSSLMLVIGYGATWWPGGAPRWVAVCFALATVLQLCAFCLLGAVRRDGRVGSVVAGVAVMGVLVGGALVYAILAADPGATEELVLGMPRRAALVLYGVGVAPLVVLSVVFVWDFEKHERHEKHEKHEKHGGGA
jgi:hypothetical protein